MAEQHEVIRERIRKLLNMTVERGCTEDEADTAMRMASGLAAKIGIELDELRPAGSPKPKITQKSQYKKMKVYEAYCAHAAAILYGVQCVAPNFGKHGFWFTGRESNIELAEQTMLWLVRQVDLLYKEALPKGLTQKARSEFRASFKDACASRVYIRAQDMRHEMETNEQAAQEATGKNALVVSGYFKTLRSEIEEYHQSKYEPTPEQKKQREEQAARFEQWKKDNPEEWARMQKEEQRQQKKWERQQARRKGTLRARQPKRGSGTSAGFQAGERVKLRKEID